MSRARGGTFGASPLPRPALPRGLKKLLPEDTQRAWKALRLVLPGSLYLIGGTAVAVHLEHRESRDLDFFCHDRSLDLDALAKELEERIGFHQEHRADGTLLGLLGKTKVEIFVEVDEENPQRVLQAPSAVAGLRIASMRDLAAMKVKVIGDRSEMRDYFDLKLIEEEGSVSVEDSLVLFCERYCVDLQSSMLEHIIRALGYLDDVVEDEKLPITKEELAAWWRKRQATLIRNLDQRARP